MSEKTNHMRKSDQIFVPTTLEVTEQVTETYVEHSLIHPVKPHRKILTRLERCS